MKWSKLKKLTETLLADSLKKRIQYHVTQYAGDSYTMARGWITLDDNEIANFSTVEWLWQRGDLEREIEDINKNQDWMISDQKNELTPAWSQASEILQKQGVFSRDQFYDSLEEYVQLSIEAALNSQNPIIQSIAMFDRRCGIRRLKSMKLPDTSNALIKNFYRIRCEAEGIQAAA